MTLGPNGQIFVLDRSTDRIVVFSGDGEFVRSFGGSGEGPGEFRSPMALAWDGTGRLWVADGLNGRYHVLRRDRHVPEVCAKTGSRRHAYSASLVFEGTGTLMTRASQCADPQWFYSCAWTRWDASWTRWRCFRLLRLQLVFRTPIIRPSQESARFLANHYIPRLRWSLAPDGTIWSASTGRLRLVQTTPGGDTIRVVETSHRTPTFDRADQKANCGRPRGRGHLETGCRCGPAGGQRDLCDGTMATSWSGSSKRWETLPASSTYSARRGTFWAASTWVLAFPVATCPRSSGTRSSRSHPGFSMYPSSCALR